MIRIYLDWNIFSKMRKKDESVLPLINFISEYEKEILLPYSSSHLSDLQRSYLNSEKGKIETNKDLIFLNELTKGCCFHYDYKSKTISPEVINPIEYFKENFSEKKDFSINFESLFPENDEVSIKLKTIWDNLMKKPSGIDLSQIENIPEDYKPLLDYFQKSKKDNTIGSIIEDLLNLLNNPDDYNVAYKKARNASNRELKINTGNKDWNDPFDYLSKQMKKGGLDKNFEELVGETIKNSTKEPTRYEAILNYYIQLDMFGYYKDKNATNLMDDAFHSFAAAHADYYITDDKNALKKTETIFKHFNISTKVVDSTKAIYELRKIILFKNERPLEEQIPYLLSNSVILKESFDDDLNPATIVKVEPLLFNFFNRMQISFYSDYHALIFFKRNNNYNTFYFWKEISRLVNKMTIEFGVDTQGRNDFQESEKQEIRDRNWVGRKWGNDKILLILQYDYNQFGLIFEINIMNSTIN